MIPENTNKTVAKKLTKVENSKNSFVFYFTYAKSVANNTNNKITANKTLNSNSVSFLIRTFSLNKYNAQNQTNQVVSANLKLH